MNFFTLCIICFFFCFIQDGGPQFAAMIFFGYVLYWVYRLATEDNSKKYKGGVRRAELMHYYDFNMGFVNYLRGMGNTMQELDYMVNYEYLRKDLIDYGVYYETETIKNARKTCMKLAKEANMTYENFVKTEYHKIQSLRDDLHDYNMSILYEEPIIDMLKEYSEQAKTSEESLAELAGRGTWIKFDKFIPENVSYMFDHDYADAKKEYEEYVRKTGESN